MKSSCLVTPYCLCTNYLLTESVAIIIYISAILYVMKYFSKYYTTNKGTHSKTKLLEEKKTSKKSLELQRKEAEVSLQFIPNTLQNMEDSFHYRNRFLESAR